MCDRWSADLRHVRLMLDTSRPAQFPFGPKGGGAGARGAERHGAAIPGRDGRGAGRLEDRRGRSSAGRLTANGASLERALRVRRVGILGRSLASTKITISTCFGRDPFAAVPNARARLDQVPNAPTSRARASSRGFVSSGVQACKAALAWTHPWPHRSIARASSWKGKRVPRFRPLCSTVQPDASWRS